MNGSLKDASVAQGVDKLDTLASNETTRDEEDGVAEKPRKSVFRDVGPLET